MSYSLDNLENFTDDQINQIILYFNGQLLDTKLNRLNAIILSFNNNLLIDNDKVYVMNPEFNKLYSATLQQLLILAQERGFVLPEYTKIKLIKYILDNLNATVIPIVNTISNDKTLSIYNNSLYLCGSTFHLKDQLKTLGGIWNPSSKCWNFPLTARNNLLNILPVSIPQEIPIIDQIPIKIPNNLQIYQNNNMVLLCGSKTYELQDQLRALNGKFDTNIKCWTFASNQAKNVLDLYNSKVREDYIEAQKIQEQRNTTRQLNQQKIREYQLRAQIPEPEAILTTTDIDQLRLQWNDKIQILNNKGDVTYTGDLKPPNLALEYKVNNWQPIRYGSLVTKTDYKKYNVTIFGSD